MNLNRLMRLAVTVLIVLAAGAPSAWAWGDDFDDNARNTELWDYLTNGDGVLTETNQRLEHTCLNASPQDNVASYVLTYPAPFDTPWDVTVDVHLDRDAFSNPQPFLAYGVGLNVQNVSDGNDQIWLGHLNGTDGDVWGLCAATDGGESNWDTPASPDANDGRLRLSWSGEYFTAYYDENDGAGFQQLQRFFVDGWGMSGGDTFSLAVAGFSEGAAILDGSKLYLDNFVLSPGPETRWTGGTGDWFDGGYWDANVPTDRMEAHIENGGTAQIQSGTAVAAAVYIGVTGSGRLEWSGGTLTTDSIHVGPGGWLNVSLDANWTYSGHLEQSGGDVLAASLVLDGGGTIHLSDGNCWVGSLAVGANSVGTFTQTGGVLEPSYLAVGLSEGSQGTYNLIDGNCNAMMAVYVGVDGGGELTQTGGVLTANGLYVGCEPNSVGVYHVGGTARVNCEMSTIRVGVLGVGTFHQTGGTVVADFLSFGNENVPEHPGGTGTYHLTGGELRIRNVTMADGNGTLIVDGGQLVHPDGPPMPEDDPPDVTFSFGMASHGHFTFGGTNGRLRLGDLWSGLYIMANNTFTQTGGTVLVNGLDISSMGGDPNERPAYNMAGGELLIESGDISSLDIGDGGTLNLSGGKITVQNGSVSIGGDSGQGVLNVSGGELHVLYGTSDPMMLEPTGGMIHVGQSMWDGNGLLNVSGGTIRAGALSVLPLSGDPEMRPPPSCVRMAGGRILLTGDWVDDGAGEPSGNIIGGRLEGHGTIASVESLLFMDWATLAPAGGMLTLDTTLCSLTFDQSIWDYRIEDALHLPVSIPAGAGLRTRGNFTGPVVNAGTLAAYGGTLRLLGEVANTGTLANTPFATLFVHPVSLDHTGSIEAYSEGGVSFNQPIVNHAGQSIALYGGTVYAPHITNAPGGVMTGTGTIHADVTNQGTTSFFSDVRIFGNVVNEPDANWMLSDGDLRIFGHTRNEGRIKILNSEAIFHGGYDGNGTLDIDPALAVMAADLTVGPGGVVALDADSTLQLRGDFHNASTRAADFNLTGTVQFHGAGTQDLEAAGADLGTDPNGWIENFALGRLRLEPDVRLRLTDAFDNRLDGEDDEAVYVDQLDLASGAWIDLDGRRLYYRNGGAAKQLLHADFDLSGDVGRSDRLILEATFGTASGAGWIDGDTNGDGAVDFLDYLTWKANVGLSSATGDLPEPAGLLLFAPALGMLLRRRCSRRRAHRS